MESQTQYLQQRSDVVVTNQHHHAKILDVSRIKVETDLGVYRCHASHYHNGNNTQSSHSGVNFCDSSLSCNSLYEKSGPSSNTGFPNERKICNTASSSLKALNSTAHQTDSGESGHNLSQGPVSAAIRCQGTVGDGDQQIYSELKNKKDDNTSLPWLKQNDRLQSDIPQISKIAQGSVNRSVNSIHFGEKDDHDSRQAFDLTCRNRASSSGEASLNHSPDFSTKEGTLKTETVAVQSRCSPKPQTCKVCGKVLSSASSYYVHMKLHSGNKPYACTECEASFCRKPYLEVHMRTHTGERPFKCDMCWKRFTQKSSLNTHKRVHTGEKPYSCDICHKTFAVKSYVTAHR